MGWLAVNILSAFLLPPLNLILLGALGLWLYPRRPTLGRCLIVLALAALYLLSTPLVGDRLIGAIEVPPLSLPGRPAAQAIVVLGGGTQRAPEYGGRTLSAASLERVRYAARLHRATGRPVLVTGGDPSERGSSEGGLMRETLERDFATPVRWVEDRSEDTRENAGLAAAILGKAGIRRVYLVTHAWHMPRARIAFERAGLEVVPAPTGYAERDVKPMDFLPGVGALGESRHALHEWIGMLWYEIRARLERS